MMSSSSRNALSFLHRRVSSILSCICPWALAPWTPPHSSRAIPLEDATPAPRAPSGNARPLENSLAWVSLSTRPRQAKASAAFRARASCAAKPRPEPLSFSPARYLKSAGSRPYTAPLEDTYRPPGAPAAGVDALENSCALASISQRRRQAKASATFRARTSSGLLPAGILPHCAPRPEPSACCSTRDSKEAGPKPCSRQASAK